MPQDLGSFLDRNKAPRIGREGIVRELSIQFPNRSLIELRETVEVFLTVMTEALLSGKRVELRGFGSMQAHRRGQRRSYVPKTKRLVKVDAKWTVKFNTGKQMKRALMENLER